MRALCLALCLSLFPALGQAAVAQPAEGVKLFRAGDYQGVINAARTAVQQDPEAEEWQLLLGRALFEIGQYAEARTSVEAALRTLNNSLRLRLLGREIAFLNGDPERAQTLLDELEHLAIRSWAYHEPADRLALGRIALMTGTDPKKVLDQFYDPERKKAPEFREAYLAAVELALDKTDFALAGRLLGPALQKFPDDPDLQFARARAFAPSDPKVTGQALEACLAANPNHPGATLLLAEEEIDAERYPEAQKTLAEALTINPARPETHALLAVLAELTGDSPAAQREQAAAFTPWARNPAVEHLIGRKLSQKYRFADGSGHQRRALEFDPSHLAAKLQLAQDLLRLGEEEEGWKLAAEVQEADPYDVVAYNLVTLQEKTSHFSALESPHFLVRMEPSEAAVYGPQVVSLLEDAHRRLCAKYGLVPTKRTTVEIFPDPKDFAIRTFSLPGGAGYLGVCFGPVITANSPAAMQGSFHSWQAILWHEFAHVVTLGLTKNRMPRWLSEGISVYEERQARRNWGEQMKPRYRAMILGEDFAPLSELSASFLRPKSPVHLQFAYYESSLAVEYLMQQFGLPALVGVCADLAAGKPVNEALASRCAPIADLDREFAARAQALAKATGPTLDWAMPEKGLEPGPLAQWRLEHPESYLVLKESATRLQEKHEWEASKEPLRKWIERYPDQHESDNAYTLLARAHRQLGETDAERAELLQVVQLSSDAVPALERLLQIDGARQDWPAVLTSADALAGIDPLRPALYRARGEAYVALHQPQPAIDAYQTVLKLDENAPPELHYHLALAYREAQQPAAAKRELLDSLQDAPRNRDALRLLLELNQAH